MLAIEMEQMFWFVVVGFMIAFVLAFGIGANDVANSFGTSVGSKVLTMKQACILATIFEILGSILIGSKVSGTIRKGILDPLVFVGSEKELMLGYVSALSGCCIWLIIATILNLPVSGTHSIVGATVGMAIVSKGIKVIKWFEVIKIVASWFISPILSGVISMLMFMLIRRLILRAKNPLESGLKFLPVIYTLTITINMGGIVESAPPLLGLDKVPDYGKVIIIAIISVMTYLIVWLVLCPFMKKKVEKTIANYNANQLFQQEEEEKNNYYNSNDHKQTIATQVDYVELIVSRNTDHQQHQPQHHHHGNNASGNNTGSTNGTQYHMGRPVPQLEFKAVETPPVKDVAYHSDVDLVPDKLMSKRPYTIHSQSHSISNNSFAKRHRMRLDSAPSSVNKESQDQYGGVNMALGGYLHSTVYSPASKVKTHNQKFQSPGLYRQYSAGSSDVWKKYKDPSESDLPTDPQATAQSPLAATVPMNSSSEAEKKLQVGRFTSVPASIVHERESFPTEKEQMAVDDLIEMDAVVDEDISEILKKKKKVLVDDQFASSDPPEAAKLFSFLQILTAVFGAFAHGGNDVSNAIGPLIGLYLIYQDNNVTTKTQTPEWILFYGGVGISVGLWVLGRRVIKTIGEDLTKITASSGFVIELASAMTVLVASLIRLPVSTTHCKVGSVVFTGRVRSKESVDWSLFRNIIIAWIVTVPVAGSLAAAVQVMLKLAYGLPL